MDRKALTIAAAVLLLAAALPAVGQAQQGARPNVQTLLVRVQNTGTGEIELLPITQRIPLESGGRYRISLVGSPRAEHRVGDGVPVQARFAEAAGKGAIALGNSGGNWVIVETTNKSNGQAELSYQVEGEYDMPAALRTGRIRFDLVRASGEERALGLSARVQNLRTGQVQIYDLDRVESIPLDGSEALRISLVDRASRGEDLVEADFDAGSGLTIERSGDNWVIVRPTAGSGSAQLSFDPEGTRYAEGSIRFDLAGTSTGGGSTAPVGGSDRARWERSEELVGMLYRTVLNQEPRAESERDFYVDVGKVYKEGFEGLRELARDLAREAEERDVFEREPASEVVGDMYRAFLGRTASTQDLYRMDEGFREFVDQLDERNGLVAVVDGIVGSEEFRRKQDLESHGLLRAARN
jgi:hypothetical protein